MAVIYKRSEALTPTEFSYCPGCGHGIATKIVAECLEEMGLIDKAIGVAPVGCGSNTRMFFNVDMLSSMHGRACANATGLKRFHPDALVFTYQGDGDFGAIGTAESVHAAHRGEKITAIVINNTVYGMTGGQMAPTTLPGQKTTTSPEGRDPKLVGTPLKFAEMIASIDSAKYVARVAVDSPAHIREAKKAIKRAFTCQLEGKGFSMVEILSTCPTNWGLAPSDAMQWLRDNMIPYYKLGVLRDFED